MLLPPASVDAAADAAAAEAAAEGTVLPQLLVDGVSLGTADRVRELEEEGMLGEFGCLICCLAVRV